MLGGAEGQVTGGTGRYSGASGGYPTRLKVKFVDGNPVYYDEFYFRFRDVRVANWVLLDPVAPALAAPGPSSSGAIGGRLCSVKA